MYFILLRPKDQFFRFTDLQIKMSVYGNAEFYNLDALTDAFNRSSIPVRLLLIKIHV